MPVADVNILIIMDYLSHQINLPNKQVYAPSVEQSFFWVFFISCFVAGGTAQFLGFISNTVTTFLLIFLYLLYQSTKISLTMKLKWNSFYIVFIFFALDIIFAGKSNNKGLLRTCIYLLYVMVPFCTYYFIHEYINEKNIRGILRCFIVIAVVQLPVLIFQHTLYPYLMALTSVKVRDEDIGFGTFFLKSDASLGFFLLCLVVFILFDKKSNFIKHKVFIVVWLSLTLAISGSKISLLLLVLILMLRFLLRCKKHLLLFIVFVLCVIIFTIKYSGPVITEIVNESSRVVAWERTDQIPRYAPLFIFASMPVKIFGDGPCTFYDPITSEWKYGGGHSLWYFIYCDLGLFGIFLTITVLFLLAKNGKRKGSNFSYLYFFVLLIISFFNTSMSDIAMMFSYSFYLSTWKFGFIAPAVKHVNQAA